MTEQDLGEPSPTDPGTAREASEAFDRERDLSILNVLDNELDEVRAALDRLEDGTYGRCEQCGGPVEPERLEALPATRYCARHEGAREAPPL